MLKSMLSLKSFTSIDFETFTAERSSACAIGLVKVVNGCIVQKFFSLINPIPNDREHNNSAVHGITQEMVNAAPPFKYLWPLIKDIIGSDVLVAHNAEFDHAVFEQQLLFYKLADPAMYEFACTFQMTGLSLEDGCKKHHIDMGCHHDALDDALACAKLCLAENGIIQANIFKGGISSAISQFRAKRYERSTLDALDDMQIKNKETPFFHARTVVTGTFCAYPNRNELGKILQSLGADMNTSISPKTNIVVIGDGAGPSKLKKIEDLRASGVDIRIIYEPELVEILSTNS